MTCIPVAICRFSDNNFKCLYLKKERLFVDFLLYFQNVAKFRTFWKKEYSGLIITEIIASERDIYLSV